MKISTKNTVKNGGSAQAKSSISSKIIWMSRGGDLLSPTNWHLIKDELIKITKRKTDLKTVLTRFVLQCNGINWSIQQEEHADIAIGP